jgi:hypothetical protein
VQKARGCLRPVAGRRVRRNDPIIYFSQWSSSFSIFSNGILRSSRPWVAVTTRRRGRFAHRRRQYGSAIPVGKIDRVRPLHGAGTRTKLYSGQPHFAALAAFCLRRAESLKEILRSWFACRATVRGRKLLSVVSGPAKFSWCSGLIGCTTRGLALPTPPHDTMGSSMLSSHGMACVPTFAFARARNSAFIRAIRACRGERCCEIT